MWEPNKKINHLGTRDSHSLGEVNPNRQTTCKLFIFISFHKEKLQLPVHPFSHTRGVEWAMEANKTSLAIYPRIKNVGGQDKPGTA